MTKLISAILSLTILFGTGAAPASATEVTANVPVIVGAQQAVYEKYSTSSSQELNYFLQAGASFGSSGSGYTSGAKSYTMNPKTGEIILSDYISIPNIKVGDKLYDKQIKGIMLFQVSSIKDGQFWASKQYYDKYTQNVTVYAKGSFLSDVTAVANSLPTDGRHTDGYWYVFKNLVEE